MAGRRNNRGMESGQAIVEFVVALVAAVVLFAGLLQIGLLAKTHTAVMNEARRRAGMYAVEGGIGGIAPEYVARWDDGADRLSYSADDRKVPGSSALFALVAGERSAHGLELAGTRGANELSLVTPFPDTVLSGFQCGRSSASVPLMPVIRHLVYASDSVELKSEIWMVNLDVPGTRSLTATGARSSSQ